MQTTIQGGNKSVEISQQGATFVARLFVRGGATDVSDTFASFKDATRWASRQVFA